MYSKSNPATDQVLRLVVRSDKESVRKKIAANESPLSIDFRALESTHLPCLSSPSQKSMLSLFGNWCTREYCLPRSTLVLPKALADGWPWPLGGGQDRNVSARHDSCQPVNVTVASTQVSEKEGSGRPDLVRHYTCNRVRCTRNPHRSMERVARDSLLGKSLVRRSAATPSRDLPSLRLRD